MNQDHMRLLQQDIILGLMNNLILIRLDIINLDCKKYSKIYILIKFKYIFNDII